MISFSKGPIFSANIGCDQPPNWKPLVGSSSGPPGACMTQSSDWKIAPVSLRIDGFSAKRSLDLRDIDLAHGHHGLERALGGGAIRIVHRLQENPWRDLPGKGPFVLAPAAGAFLAAGADDRVPVSVGLFLTFGQDHEADRLIRLEQVSAVQADELLAEHGKVDCDFITFFPAGR